MNEENVIAVGRQGLLNFFDEVPDASRKHATSIVSVAGEELGVALLVHYLATQGTQARVIGDCNQGTKSGVRLDAWVEAGSVLYQVEVKNWSAHAIGGRVLPIDASPGEAARYRVEMWKNQWDGEGFTLESVSKVLVPMKPPVQHQNIEPLIAFWTALHPNGDPEPFFRVSVKGAAFPAVNVFSMSNYLRQCTGDRLLLHMPATCRRLRWLSTLFSTAAADAVAG